MKDFFAEIRGAVMGTIVLAFVCCGLYPLAVFGLAQLAFRDKANGSLIMSDDGTVRGSRLLGQNFTAPKYFHPRPSAAGDDGYDATSSGAGFALRIAQSHGTAIHQLAGTFDISRRHDELDNRASDPRTNFSVRTLTFLTLAFGLITPARSSSCTPAAAWT